LPEQGAADAAVVQRATIENQTDLNFHAEACVEIEITDAPF
jgi:hypothetical protein